MGLLIYLVFFLFLLSLGFVVGGLVEKKHFQDLAEREANVTGVLASQIRSFPQASGGSSPQIVIAEAVVSSDYLKSFLAGIRGIFGGEVRSFQTILQRARREAVLKLKEQAVALGYNAVCNIRIETADVAGRGMNQKNKIVMATILASGTAYHASQPTDA